MASKKKLSDVDRELLLAALESSDEMVRARAVGSLCPCDKGWEVFEQYAHIVSQLTKDSSAAVRASALPYLTTPHICKASETLSIAFSL